MNVFAKLAQFRLQKFKKDVEHGQEVSLKSIESVLEKGALQEAHATPPEFFKPFFERCSFEIFQLLAKSSPKAIRPQLLGWALSKAKTGEQAKSLLKAGADLRAVFPGGYPAWMSLSKFSECAEEFNAFSTQLTVKDFEGALSHQIPRYEIMEWLVRFSSPEAFEIILDQHISPNFPLFSNGDWNRGYNDSLEKRFSDHCSHTEHGLLQYCVMELVRPDLPLEQKERYEKKIALLVSRGAQSDNHLGYNKELRTVIRGQSDPFLRENWVAGSPEMIKAVDRADIQTKLAGEFREYFHQQTSKDFYRRGQKARSLSEFWTGLEKLLEKGLNITGTMGIHVRQHSLLSNVLSILQCDFWPEGRDKFKQLFEDHVLPSQKAQQASLALRVCTDPDLAQWLWGQGAHLNATFSYYERFPVSTAYIQAVDNWSFFEELVKTKQVDINDATEVYDARKTHGVESVHWGFPLGVQMMLHASSYDFDRALKVGLDANQSVHLNGWKKDLTFAQILAERCKELGAPHVAGGAEEARKKDMLECADFLLETFQILLNHGAHLHQGTESYPKTPIEILKESMEENASRPFLVSKLEELIEKLTVMAERSHLNDVLTKVSPPEPALLDASSLQEEGAPQDAPTPALPRSKKRL